MPDPQQQWPLAEREDQPYKFKAGPDSIMVTGSKTGLGAKGAQPSTTTSELNLLDKELGKEKVNDVLEDYFEET